MRSVARPTGTPAALRLGTASWYRRRSSKSQYTAAGRGSRRAASTRGRRRAGRGCGRGRCSRGARRACGVAELAATRPRSQFVQRVRARRRRARRTRVAARRARPTACRRRSFSTLRGTITRPAASTVDARPARTACRRGGRVARGSRRRDVGRLRGDFERAGPRRRRRRGRRRRCSVSVSGAAERARRAVAVSGDAAGRLVLRRSVCSSRFRSAGSSVFQTSQPTGIGRQVERVRLELRARHVRPAAPAAARDRPHAAARFLRPPACRGRTPRRRRACTRLDGSRSAEFDRDAAPRSTPTTVPSRTPRLFGNRPRTSFWWFTPSRKPGVSPRLKVCARSSSSRRGRCESRCRRAPRRWPCGRSASSRRRTARPSAGLRS